MRLGVAGLFFFLYTMLPEASDSHNASYTTLSGLVFGNGLVLGEEALSRNLKLTTTLNRAITQNHCYVPLNFNAQCLK